LRWVNDYPAMLCSSYNFVIVIREMWCTYILHLFVIVINIMIMQWWLSTCV
jgi:hypothetical protein